MSRLARSQRNGTFSHSQSRSRPARRGAASRVIDDEAEDEVDDAGGIEDGPESGEDEGENDVDDDDDNDDGLLHRRGDQGAQADIPTLSKKLVRLALSTEFSRQPLRRTDISAKVLAGYPRVFKDVFSRAQKTLATVFGMTLLELPTREKVTIHQRRAAMASGSKSASSNSWILVSVLPDKYRTPTILSSRYEATDSDIQESAYVALYTFVVALVALNGGTLPEPRLDRYLQRASIESATPVDRTDRVLARMMKEGYIFKVKETTPAGEEAVEYHVGPRAKAEIGNEGVAKLVTALFGDSVDPAELEKKIKRSLGIDVGSNRETGNDEEGDD